MCKFLWRRTKSSYCSAALCHPLSSTNYHIIFCAVDFATHRKYVSNKKSYYQIRGVSDRLCKEHGLSVVTPGQERFTRSKTLGEAYTVEAITERIAGTYRAKPKALRQEKAGVSMLIDIQNSIKAAESKGFEFLNGA